MKGSFVYQAVLAAILLQAGGMARGQQTDVSQGLSLPPGWNNVLEKGTLVLDELQQLLNGRGNPAVELGPHPDIAIYKDVHYLDSFNDACAKFGKTAAPQTVQVTTPGFPERSFTYYVLDGVFDDGYTKLLIVVDLKKQVVALEFTEDAMNQPGGSTWGGNGKVCDFVRLRMKGVTNWGVFHEVKKSGRGRSSCLIIDSLLVGEHKNRQRTRLFLPQPIVNLILFRLSGQPYVPPPPPVPTVRPVEIAKVETGKADSVTSRRTKPTTATPTVHPKKVAPSPPGETHATAEGFRPLFNGQDLTGWTPMLTTGRRSDTQSPTTGGWIAQNGELVCATDANGWLKSDRQYGDFVLQLEFKLPSQGHSGVYIRSPDSGLLSQAGMQIQIIDPEYKTRAGKLAATHKTGAIWGVVGLSQPPDRPIGEWNSMEIRCEGDKVEVTLNGERTASANMSQESKLRDRPRSGSIGIINWQGAAKGVSFRNIRISAYLRRDSRLSKAALSSPTAKTTRRSPACRGFLGSRPSSASRAVNRSS